MLFQTTGLPLIPNPPLGFRFGVVFLTKGKIPNVVDVRFKSVSGIGATLVTDDVEKSSVTTQKRNVTKSVKYGNLTLDRGVLLGSPLSNDVEIIFREMLTVPVDIIVSILNEGLIPVKSWIFNKAYPVSWSISGIDAASSEVLIERIEFEYSRFASLSL